MPRRASRNRSLVCLSFLLALAGLLASWSFGPAPAQAASETLVLPYVRGKAGVQTVREYSGRVTIVVSGVGRSGINELDAFYLVNAKDQNNLAIPPYHPTTSPTYTLLINGQPTDAFVDPIPPYNPEHVYSFAIDVPAGPVSFAIDDDYTANNSGQLTIRVDDGVPTVALSPRSGPAGTSVSATGSSVTPGAQGQAQWLWPDGRIAVLSPASADENGEFRVTFDIPSEAAPGDYTLIFSLAFNLTATFSVTEASKPDPEPEPEPEPAPEPDPPPNPLDAYRQAAQPKSGCTHYAETGHNLCAGFRQYWERFGGLAIFGFPITEEFTQNGLTTQYFERARFEWHPGTWPERFDVQLGLLGVELVVERRAEIPFRTAQPKADCTYFAETGHNLCGGFRQYFDAYGGLATYGFPISEEFREVNPDTGREYTVQYFERQRFEWHPGEWPPRFDVMLGRLGVQILDEGAGSTS